MTTSITFVSAILRKDANQNIGDLLVNFTVLASSGIRICLFVSSEFEEDVRHGVSGFPNVSVMATKDVSDSWISTTVSNMGESIELPNNRNEEKDTKEFILSGHVKHEILLDVVEKNPFQTTHFAWIDSDIAKIFKNNNESISFLQWLHKITMAKSFITFPGCWAKLDKDKPHEILNSVNWRFCGGFFIGDKESIQNFCILYKKKIVEFLELYKKLVWDFNFWAWMETFCEDEWKPIWYRGDHDDSILITSADFYTRVLQNITRKVEYHYPAIEKYYPTSASYLYYNNKHLLNTRYVNYWIYPNGSYLFNSGTKLIENKNILSELEDEKLEPIYYKEVEENINLNVVDTFSKGLEDIRLYEYEGRVKYVATTAGYSESGKSRIIVGNYNVETAEICDGTIIQPPDSNANSWCEKNWIPIIRNNKIMLGDGSIVEQEEELFIYKWSPMEIGKIDYESKQLKIIHKYEVNFPLFSKIRGSSLFYETDAGLIGVVHYSEEHSPRHYYHMLVLLEKDSYIPLRYTETFCFEKLGIEFCLGFTIKYSEDIVCKDRELWDDELQDEYVFWISRHDRDPMMICVGVDEIKWL